MFARGPQKEKPTTAALIFKVITLCIALAGTFWLIFLIKNNPPTLLFQ